MKLGLKINLTLGIVTTIVLTIAFGIIVNTQARSVEQQALNSSEAITDMLKDTVQRTLASLKEDQEKLRASIKDAVAVQGVKYLEVFDINGYDFSTNEGSFFGGKISENKMSVLKRVIEEGGRIEIQSDKDSLIELEHYIPVRVRSEDVNSRIIGVMNIVIIPLSKNTTDIAQAERSIQTVYSLVEENARRAILTRRANSRGIQALSEKIKNFSFYHDIIIFDNTLNVLGSSEYDLREFDRDPQEYKQYREDVLAGKINSASYKRTHKGEEVLVQIRPIEFNQPGKTMIIGLAEAHLLTASYKDKVAILKFHMIGIGVVVTVILVFVLAIILRKEVVGPITRYSLIAQKVADGDTTQRVEHYANDEIGRFGEVFNIMVGNLRELDNFKTDFISVAAHQLRTPLSSLKWALKLILDNDLGPITEEQRSMLNRGYDTNEKMIRLVNDLLDVSRIENGKFKYKFEQNDIAKLLMTLVENAEPASLDRNIEVRLEPHKEIPPFVFDFEKLLIAIQNIIDNSIKYTLPGGRVTIKMEQQEDYLRIKISDTGVGIPVAEIPKIFSKFFRASNVVHLQTEGSGLGLVISKSIIAQHGGQIEVNSVEGQGTTFTVRIPLLAELIPKEEKGDTKTG